MEFALFFDSAKLFSFINSLSFFNKRHESFDSVFSVDHASVSFLLMLQRLGERQVCASVDGLFGHSHSDWSLKGERSCEKEDKMDKPSRKKPEIWKNEEFLFH